jgi:hypothetical protein
VKKVIELLEKAEGSIMLAFSGTSEMDLLTEVINYLNDAMAEQKHSVKRVIEKLEIITDTVSIVAAHIMPGSEYELLCGVREGILAVISELKQEDLNEKGD